MSDTINNSDKVIFNGKEITKEEFEKLQENVSQQKNTTLVEVAKGEFKQRLKD